ncbi:MAG: amidohydrolase family protein [Candidatus Woesearchaeota archaeon]
MILDVHNHVGKDRDGQVQTLEMLQESMRISGVTHAVIFPFACDGLIEESIALLEETKHLDNIFVFLRFNPTKTTPETLRKVLDLGFKGVKLHPNSEQFDIADESTHWIYPVIASYKIPIIFHTKASQEHSNPLKVLYLAKQYPSINFILGHFFGDSFEAMQKAKDIPNVYSEISIFGRTLRIQELVEAGFDRLLLGSDSPFDDMRVAKSKIDYANISKEDKEKIYSENAKKVLGV